MKIYIVGVGGIGGYFGGLLAKSGLDVTFVARKENYKALQEHGLQVMSVLGNFVINPVAVIEHISEIVNPDLIIFSVKTYDIQSVAAELASVVTKDTVILTFQNGIDNDIRINEVIKNAQVYPGVAYIITAKTKPGVIEQTGGLRKLVFGDRKMFPNKKLREIEKLMIGAGVDAKQSDDITRDIWKKFLFICPFAGMTAFHRKTIGEILSNHETENQYEECLKEAISVAKAKGVNISDNAFEELMTTARNTAPASKSSLLLDIENDRRNEIETLHGTLVRIANEHGVAVPVTKLIYNTIKDIY